MRTAPLLALLLFACTSEDPSDDAAPVDTDVPSDTEPADTDITTDTDVEDTDVVPDEPEPFEGVGTPIHAAQSTSFQLQGRLAAPIHPMVGEHAVLTPTTALR